MQCIVWTVSWNLRKKWWNRRVKKGQNSHLQTTQTTFFFSPCFPAVVLNNFITNTSPGLLQRFTAIHPSSGEPKTRTATGNAGRFIDQPGHKGHLVGRDFFFWNHFWDGLIWLESKSGAKLFKEPPFLWDFCIQSKHTFSKLESNQIGKFSENSNFESNHNFAQSQATGHFRPGRKKRPSGWRHTHQEKVWKGAWGGSRSSDLDVLRVKSPNRWVENHEIWCFAMIDLAKQESKGSCRPSLRVINTPRPNHIDQGYDQHAERPGYCPRVYQNQNSFKWRQFHQTVPGNSTAGWRPMVVVHMHRQRLAILLATNGAGRLMGPTSSLSSGEGTVLQWMMTKYDSCDDVKHNQTYQNHQLPGKKLQLWKKSAESPLSSRLQRGEGACASAKRFPELFFLQPYFFFNVPNFSIFQKGFFFIFFLFYFFFAASTCTILKGISGVFHATAVENQATESRSRPQPGHWKRPASWTTAATWCHFAATHPIKKRPKRHQNTSISPFLFWTCKWVLLFFRINDWTPISSVWKVW